jgi:hypothetical protein
MRVSRNILNSGNNDSPSVVLHKETTLKAAGTSGV